MRTLITAIIIAAVAVVAAWFAPWWTAILVAAIVGFLSGLRPGNAFLAGFAGLGLMWLLVFLWRDIPNQQILSERMGRLFGLPSHFFFLLVTVLIGSLLGGLGSWSTALLRRR